MLFSTWNVCTKKKMNNSRKREGRYKVGRVVCVHLICVLISLYVLHMNNVVGFRNH